MSIKYRISYGNNTYDYNTKELAEIAKSKTPEFANIEIEEIEVPDPVITKDVPQSVPLWCLLTVLDIAKLLQPVKDAIAALPEGPQKIAAGYAMERAKTIERVSPTVAFVQQVLQLTNEQVDDIFIEADKVEA